MADFLSSDANATASRSLIARKWKGVRTLTVRRLACHSKEELTVGESDQSAFLNKLIPWISQPATSPLPDLENVIYQSELEGEGNYVSGSDMLDNLWAQFPPPDSSIRFHWLDGNLDTYDLGRTFEVIPCTEGKRLIYISRSEPPGLE